MVWIALALVALLCFAFTRRRHKVPLLVIYEGGEGLEGVVRRAVTDGRRVYVSVRSVSPEAMAILAILEADLAGVRRVEGAIEDVLDVTPALALEVTRLGPGTDVAQIIRTIS